jgi:hypothetical protein
MKNDNTLLDGIADVAGTLLLGGVILWVFRLLIMGYVYLSAICVALFSELIWPSLRWLFKETGIALLRTYNRLTSF